MLFVDDPRDDVLTCIKRNMMLDNTICEAGLTEQMNFVLNVLFSIIGFKFNLHELNINNSEIEWNYKGKNVPLSIKGSGAIAQYSDNIYIPRDDGNIISLKNDTGKLNWLTTISPRSGRNELDSLRDIEMTPIISDGSLFVGSYQGNLVSIDIFTGDIFWTKSMSVLSNLSVDDKNVYVSDNSSNVYAIDKYSGRNIWKTSMNGSVNSTQQFLYDLSLIHI